MAYIPRMAHSARSVFAILYLVSYSILKLDGSSYRDDWNFYFYFQNRAYSTQFLSSHVYKEKRRFGEAES